MRFNKEVKHTVKTWGFHVRRNPEYGNNVMRFNDEVNLLNAGFKSNPRLVDVFGICVDEKFAEVYDINFLCRM